MKAHSPRARVAASDAICSCGQPISVKTVALSLNPKESKPLRERVSHDEASYQRW
jgi:hypothetical protein